MTHILDLAERLPQNNIQPEILFFTEGPSIEKANKKNIPSHLIIKGGGSLIFLYRLYKFLTTNRYDILHTHTINGNFFGRLAGKIAGVPVLLTTVHSHIIDELKGLKKPSLSDHIRYKIDLFLSRWNKAMVVVAESIQKRLTAHNIPEEKIYVIENGVDTDIFRPSSQICMEVRKELGIPAERKVVGLIGRMVPLKNHSIFLQAAGEVLKEIKNVCFLIAGDGPLKENIQNHALSLGITDKVIFTGWRTDIERIITALDILVLCSQIEGHNIVILEAMSCGKPVIGTDVQGIRSIITDDKNGVLVPEGDSTALAKTISYLLNNPPKAETLGISARNFIKEKYSITRMVADYTNLYQSLTAS
jgi:glycosyltransferase involved in cell wall biosynthesis